MTVLTVNTSEFGSIEIKTEDVITFVQPIIGFDELKKFVLVEDKDFFPILWLQSIDDAGIVFPVVNSSFLNYKYDLNVSDFTLEDIEIKNFEDVLIYTLLVIPSNKIEEASTNLRAPVIVNANNRLAKQVVYDDDSHPIKHFLFQKKDEKDD